MAVLEKSGVTIFDIDKSLKADTLTKDFKDIYNEDAINQGIDIYLTNPYRIGHGTVNTIFSSLYMDIANGSEDGLIRSITDSLSKTFPEIVVKNIVAEPQPSQRSIYIRVEWEMSLYNITGTYTRYWSVQE